MNRTHTTAEVLDRMQRCVKILITGHRNPDGDCLGSAIGFAELAEKLGIETTIIFRDAMPFGLRELPGAEAVIVAEVLPEDFPSHYDLVATMECPGLDRTGFDDLHRVPILNIDHHRANDRFGELNFLDEESPAAGEMVWRLFEEAPVQPSPQAATALFAALSTDTGDFRYSNATGRAFRTAAEMVEWGADPTLVSELVHERRSLASVRLLAEALSTLEMHSDNQLALIKVGPEAFARADAQGPDTDQIVNLPRSIAGVEIVAFLKQTDAGAVRISLRSRGTTDVRSVAASFGGGGHTNAAGCSIDGNLETARDALLPKLKSLLENDR
ncbi:MAG: bifunctional oligoribonuclease/PAP phosphatase NrnA [Acidobacteriota bacterium]